MLSELQEPDFVSGHGARQYFGGPKLKKYLRKFFVAKTKKTLVMSQK